MKEQNRYRVTGTLFLLALAVVCLPMVFDGAGIPARDLPDLPQIEPLPEPTAPVKPMPEPDFVARVEALREQVDEQGFHEDTQTRFGEPVLSAPAVATEVWAVQVASFARADNAQEFRARLRDDGYEAFISTARAGGAVHSRVAVGPLLQRERAETLKDELSKRYALNARLMAFSN